MLSKFIVVVLAGYASLPTTVQKFIVKEGREEGRKEGREEGRQKVALKSLKIAYVVV